MSNLVNLGRNERSVHHTFASKAGGRIAATTFSNVSAPNQKAITRAPNHTNFRGHARAVVEGDALDLIEAG